MAIGPYVLDNTSVHTTGINYWGSTSVTFGQLYIPSATVSVKSVLLRAFGSQNFQGKAVVYNSSGVKVGEGSLDVYSGLSAGSLIELPLTAPVNIASTDSYKVGVYIGSGGGGPQNPAIVPWASTHTHTTTHPTITFSMGTNSELLYSSGDANPTTDAGNYELLGGLSFNSVTVPTAPSGISSNTPVTLGNPLTLNWTHNDAESDPAVKYQIRYRRT